MPIEQTLGDTVKNILTKPTLSNILKQKITKTQSLFTGLNSANKITLANGKILFVKSQNNANDLLIKEGRELELLGKFVNVPKVVYADEYYLVLEYLKIDGTSINQSKLGQDLAKLHQQQMPYFGFEFDNKIGSTVQQNAVDQNCQNWAEFYWVYRLLPQIQLAKKYLSADLHQNLLALKIQLSQLLPPKITPVLLHGDLWSGNVLSVNHQAYFIDPACYYGHSEADLALTYIFGGFAGEFYQSYQQIHPQQTGFEQRKYLYMLYHYLNHVNLFGTSYLSGVKRCLQVLSY